MTESQQVEEYKRAYSISSLCRMKIMEEFKDWLGTLLRYTTL